MGENKKVPVLRFPGFEGEWDIQRFGEITSRISLPVDIDPEVSYKQIGIRSHGKGIFYKESVEGKELGNKRVFWIKENAFIVNIVFAWEQAITKTTINEIGMIASHRFPMYLPAPSKANVDYLVYFFLTKHGKSLLEMASPGGAGRNKTLGQKEFENLKLQIPRIEEQTKIADFLTAVDEKLQALKKKRAALEVYKKGVMQKLFSQALRFKDENGKDFPDWEEKRLGDCLIYEQPTAYLVSSTEYDNGFATPVVTAGKTFILGYTDEENGIYTKELPVIIFDDFTTATQFVNFPFKAKSSAMKILTCAEGYHIKFFYESLQMVSYEIGGHGRHWISVFSELSVPVPSPSEQAKIANFLSSIDEKIQATQQAIARMETWKKGLLQKLFI